MWLAMLRVEAPWNQEKTKTTEICKIEEKDTAAVDFSDYYTELMMQPTKTLSSTMAATQRQRIVNRAFDIDLNMELLLCGNAIADHRHHVVACANRGISHLKPGDHRHRTVNCDLRDGCGFNQRPLLVFDVTPCVVHDLHELLQLHKHELYEALWDKVLGNWSACPGETKDKEDYPKYIAVVVIGFTTRSTSIFSNDVVFNMMAVHSAAKAGLKNMVAILCEAAQLRDANTATFHTGESLLHLAVKHGHRDVFDYLCFLGADIRRQDAAGHFVHSLTSDKSWKRYIIELGVCQQRQENLKPQVVNKIVPKLARDVVASAHQLRKSLAHLVVRGDAKPRTKLMDSRVVSVGSVTIAGLVSDDANS